MLRRPAAPLLIPLRLVIDGEESTVYLRPPNADDLAGLHATIGTLAALNHRSRTGEGQHVDVALLDAIMFQSNAHLSAGALGIPASRWGNEVGVSTPTNRTPSRTPTIARSSRSMASSACSSVESRGMAAPKGFRSRKKSRRSSLPSRTLPRRTGCKPRSRR